jgi:hypothetical protein
MSFFRAFVNTMLILGLIISPVIRNNLVVYPLTYFNVPAFQVESDRALLSSCVRTVGEIASYEKAVELTTCLCKHIPRDSVPYNREASEAKYLEGCTSYINYLDFFARFERVLSRVGLQRGFGAAVAH